MKTRWTILAALALSVAGTGAWAACGGPADSLRLSFADPAPEQPVSVSLCVGQVLLLEAAADIGHLGLGHGAVADVTPLSSRRALLTAQAPGIVSLLALPLEGAGAARLDITVLADPPGQAVTVFRGTDRSTAACDGACREDWNGEKGTVTGATP